METAGNDVLANTIKPEMLNETKIPFYLPLKLSVAELANFCLLPSGDEALAGIPALHPKLLLPAKWLKNPDAKAERSFGVTLNITPVQLNILSKDSLEHTVILGPTGSGKSMAMLNLIMADIRAGRSVLVVDPKADLINDILACVPSQREEDVVVVDPSDPKPVGLNPFLFSKQQSPSHISDAILAVFKQIYIDNWGIRTQDVLTASVLTLAHTKNATLLMLPMLLTNDNFRRKITSNINDPIGLEPFWANFEAMSKQERNQVIAPVLNKVR